MATEARNGRGLSNAIFNASTAAGTPTPQLRKESSADSAFSELTSPTELLSPNVFSDESIERSLSLYTASESSVDPPETEQSSSPPPEVPGAQEPNDCLAVASNGRSSTATASQRGRDFEGPWLDKKIDCENSGVLKHLGRIADMMYEWEGPIAEELGLTPANIAAIRMKHPSELRLQTREALLMWKQRLGEDATYRNLAHVFEDAGYQDFANFVKIKAASGENGIISRSDSINAGEMDDFTIQTIRSNEAKIKDSFSELLDCLEEALTEQAELSINKIHRYLVVTCLTTVPKASLSEMFDFVTSNNGWSYQNYGPLDNFVKRFLPHKRKQMLEYKNDVSGFCVTVKLIDYIQFRNFTAKEFQASADSERYSRSELCVKLKDKLNVERKVSTRSLQYVNDLWEDVAEDFDTPCLTAIIHKIIDGSLVIVWLVLSDTAEKIASSASTDKSIRFFLQHEIVLVSINDKVLFDTIQLLLDIVTRGDWKRLKYLLISKQYGSLFELNFPYQEGKSLLIIAAEMGQEMAMLSLLDSGADVAFKQESSGRSALHFAAENSHDAATAILLAYGADPHQKDAAGVAALDVAEGKARDEFQPYVSESAKQPTVRSISSRQIVVETVEAVKGAVLRRLIQPVQMLRFDLIGATKSGDAKTVEYILKHVKDGSETEQLIRSRENDKHGWTALMYASDKGNAKIAEQLLAKGADPKEFAKSNRWTCLMLASRIGSLKVTKMLLDHGADPNISNNEDVSPLSIALYERRTAVPLLLIHRGADIHFPDQNGWTPLIRASNEGNLKLVKVIADLGAHLNDQTAEGWSSVMVSSNYGHTEVVKELAKREADLNLATTAGDTALHIATLRNRPKVVEELAKVGADLNAGNKDGLTPLMVAADKNYVDIVDALLEGGADPNQPQKETQWTAIFFAAKNGHVEIVQNLLFYKANTDILNEGGSIKLSLLDVASHLKQTAILGVLGTSVDYTPSLSVSVSKDIDNNVRILDSVLHAFEERFIQLKKGIATYV